MSAHGRATIAAAGGVMGAQLVLSFEHLDLNFYQQPVTNVDLQFHCLAPRKRTRPNFA
jgi:hypothetical protein